MNQAQRLIELANQLPEPVLAEIVDFAEFLAQKQNHDLESLIGCMKDNPALVGCDPVAIQNEMRSEWGR